MDFIRYLAGKSVITLIVLLMFALYCTFPLQSLVFMAALFWLSWIVNGWVDQKEKL